MHSFVQNNIRYVRDVKGVETLQTPKITLILRAGDCDDHATLLAALLLSIGHPARFVAAGYNNKPYSHVYVETLIGNRWRALETTEPLPAFQRVAKPTRVMIQNL